VAALLAAEPRPGDTTLTFSSPTLSVQLSLPPPSSVTAASLESVQQGRLRLARMVSTNSCGTPSPTQCCSSACQAPSPHPVHPPVQQLDTLTTSPHEVQQARASVGSTICTCIQP
jgi:hypothetical protein